MSDPFTEPQPKGEPPYHARPDDPVQMARHLALMDEMRALQGERAKVPTGTNDAG